MLGLISVETALMVARYLCDPNNVLEGRVRAVFLLSNLFGNVEVVLVSILLELLEPLPTYIPYHV